MLSSIKKGEEIGLYQSEHKQLSETEMSSGASENPAGTGEGHPGALIPIDPAALSIRTQEAAQSNVLPPAPPKNLLHTKSHS